MTLPYKALMWSDNEPLSNDKLNAMTNNDQWLFENMPRAKYASNVSKTAGVKIMATRALIPANRGASMLTATVYFGNTFSTGCNPIVVASTIPTGWQRRYHTVVTGIGTKSLPDQTGCTITVGSAEFADANRRFHYSVYVDVIAIGW